MQNLPLVILTGHVSKSPEKGPAPQGGMSDRPRQKTQTLLLQAGKRANLSPGAFGIVTHIRQISRMD